MNCSDKQEKGYQSLHYELEKNLPKGTFYHYTSYKGLKNILKERKLRCTDYRYFNDPTELRYGKNIIIEALENSDGITPENVKVTRDLFKKLPGLWKVYIACYTTEVESLALWRYYASNGTGFAIGFNELHHTVEKSSNNKEKGVICKVIYGVEESKYIIDRFIKVYLQQPREESYKTLMCHLLTILPSFKDESFSDEHEVRVFYNEGQLILNGGKPFYFRDQYRETGPIQKNHLPFVKPTEEVKKFLKPEKFSDAAISEIWVGPALEFSTARCNVEILLKVEGFDVKNIKILESRLPFRDI